MDGKKIWPVDNKYLTVLEETITINLFFEINKGDVVYFELWDHDKLSANDLLGKLSFEANAHGHFIADFIKTGKDGSKYGLEWEIG